MLSLPERSKLPIYAIENGRRYPIEMTVENKGDTLVLSWPFNRAIIEQVKAMSGARWNPEKVAWTVDHNQHNLFRLQFLKSTQQKSDPASPYYRYDLPLTILGRARAQRTNSITHQTIRVYGQQQEFCDHIYTRRQCIVAGEMGTGKSLSAILVMEQAVEEWGLAPGTFYNPSPDFVYVAPKSVIKAINRELTIWSSKVWPTLITYDELKKRMVNWVDGRRAPRFLTLDEASRVKSSTSQRGQAAKQLADGMRQDWGDDCYIILMTGTPAPKSPEDWWHLAAIACPGFIKEGTPAKFKRRLAITQEAENLTTQGKYLKLLGWRDNPDKCDVCGQLSGAFIHQIGMEPLAHDFVPSKDEVKALYARLQGLVYIKFKKDCLDLPEKVYRLVEAKPDKSILRLAKLISKSSSTAIEGLTRLRELSDGFQYNDAKTGERDCAECNGTGEKLVHQEIPNSCLNCSNGFFSQPNSICLNHFPQYEKVIGRCDVCNGRKKIDVISRTINKIETPKDGLLIDMLAENEEIGRIVIFAAFSASIDRCVETCHAQGWHTIRIDARGWEVTRPDNSVVVGDPLSIFQDYLAEFEQVAIVAHPGSGGMGQTFTAAAMTVYFSNSFNGEERTQSEDRIHRIGQTRGCQIVDLIHLPSDLMVRDNLMAKRRLELLSLGELIDQESIRE